MSFFYHQLNRMKTCAFFLFILPFQLWAQSFSLLPVCRDQKHGLVDSTGKIILALEYDYIMPFGSMRNLLVVEKSNQKALYSISNRSFYTDFFDEISLVNEWQFIVQKGDLMGVIHRNDSLNTPIHFTSITTAPRGLLICSNDSITQIINASGITIGQLNGQHMVRHFENGYFVVQQNDKYGLYRSDGSQIIPADYNEWQNSQGLIILKSNDHQICLHIPSGELIQVSEEDNIRFINDERAFQKVTPFYLKGRKNAVKSYSVYAHDPLQYDLQDINIAAAGNGFYYLYDGEKYELADSTGKKITTEKYDRIQWLADSYFEIENFERCGIFHAEKGMLLSPEYLRITTLNDDSTGLTWFIARNQEGRILMDTTFRDVSGLLFNNVQLIDGRGFILTMNNNYRVLLDPYGKILTQGDHSSIVAAGDDFWLTSNASGRGLLDLKGNVLLENKFFEIIINGERVRAYSDDQADMFIWNGTTLIPDISFNNYRRLNLNLQGDESTNSTQFNMGPYRWVRDSVLGKWGLIDIVTNQYAISPRYDYAYTDPYLELTLTGVFCDTAAYSLGPLKFKSIMLFGLVEPLRARILANPEYSHIFFDRFINYWEELKTKINIPGAKALNSVPAIRTGTQWGTVSHQFVRYDPNVQYIGPFINSKAKAFRFDSAYVASKSSDVKICNVKTFYNAVRKFSKPADAFTDSVLKAPGAQYLFAANVDSLSFQRSRGSRNDPGLKSIALNDMPMFLYHWQYISDLEYTNALYHNMRIFESKHRFAFINHEGRLMTNFEFNNALDFSEGFAAVKQSNRWGFIDTSGQIVIETTFRKVHSFSENVAAASIKGGLFGFIDASGAWEIDPVFRDAQSFSEGLAGVKKGDDYGYIDHSGKFIIEPEFTRVTPFNNQLARVYKKRGFGLINHEGDYVLRPVFDMISAADKNLCYSVRRGKKTAIFKADGKRITPWSSMVRYAGESMYAVKNGNEHFVLYDTSGTKKQVVKSIQNPLIENNRMMVVLTRNKYYYCDSEGKTVLGPYAKASVFVNHRAVVSIADATLIIDTSGNVIKKVISNSFNTITPFDSNGIAIIRANGVYFLFDTLGIILYRGFMAPAPLTNGLYALYGSEGYYLFDAVHKKHFKTGEYIQMKTEHEGRLRVSVDGFYGFADIGGKYHAYPDYTQIKYYLPGIYRVTYGDKIGYLRYDGTIIWNVSH